MNIGEMKDRIARAEEIQRYTENRCESLEKENAELKKMYHESDEDNNKLRENIPLLAEAKEIIELLLWDLRNRSYELVKDVERAEQFIKNSEEEK